MRCLCCLWDSCDFFFFNLQQKLEKCKSECLTEGKDVHWPITSKKRKKLVLLVFLFLFVGHCWGQKWCCYHQRRRIWEKEETKDEEEETNDEEEETNNEEEDTNDKLYGSLEDTYSSWDEIKSGEKALVEDTAVFVANVKYKWGQVIMAYHGIGRHLRELKWEAKLAKLFQGWSCEGFLVRTSYTI